jgi:hypothetical protein
MDHNRQFTRPLLMRITEYGAAYVELLATRAEHDTLLADHMLEALDDLHLAFPDLAADGIAKPATAQK